MKIKIWLDTTKIPANFFDIVEGMSENYIVCVSGTIDMIPLQADPERFIECVKAGRIQVHGWKGAAAQFAKEFFMSSIGVLVKEGELYNVLPEADKYIRLIDEVSLPKESWMKEGFAWTPFPAELLKEIGLGNKANRTEVLEACKKQGRMDIWEKYNFNYDTNLRVQHQCDGILNEDGTFTIFPIPV